MRSASRDASMITDEDTLQRQASCTTSRRDRCTGDASLAARERAHVEPRSWSAARHRRERDAITRGSRPCGRAGCSITMDEGGATPAGRPAPQGAGSRLREIRGVAPPSPATPLLTPDAANSAASPSSSPRHKVMINQGLDCVSSTRSLSSSGPAKGPAEGPTGGPPDLQPVGPRHRLSFATSSAYASA